jgi:large subunit ribosomal protein L17
MLRNMVTSLLKHERIHTTDTKAKVLRGWADHLITLARRGDLHARRQALAIVREEGVVHKLFAEAKERFSASRGGYTRIVKMGLRAGDAAPMSLIELVAAEGAVAKKPSGKKAASVAADTVAAVKIPAVAEDADDLEPALSMPAAEVEAAAADDTLPPSATETVTEEGPQAEEPVKEKE